MLNTYDGFNKMIKNIQKLFDAIYKITNVPTKYLYDDLRDFSRYVCTDDDMIILDVGGGDSPYSSIFPSNYFISLDIISHDDTSIIADALFLPIRNNTMDLILCIEVMEHLSNPFLAFTELSNVLKDKKNMILTTPFLHGLHTDVDFFRLTNQALLLISEQNKLNITKINFRGGYLTTLVDILHELPYEYLGPFERKADYTIGELVKYLCSFLWYVLLIPISLIAKKVERNVEHNITCGFHVIFQKEVRR